MYPRSASSWVRLCRSRFKVGDWTVANLAANQTDATTLTFDSRVICKEYRSVVPVWVNATIFGVNSLAATPAGTLTVSIFVDGVDAGSAYDLVMSGVPTGTQRHAKTHSTPLAVAAGSDIDLRWSTSADWNSTSADISAWLEMSAVVF